MLGGAAVARRRDSLEGDVVVGCGGSASAYGGGLEIGGVYGDVGAGGEASAALLAASAEELDAVGDDVDGLALVALGGLPLAPLEAAVDRDAAALGQVLGAVLALGAPDGDVEVVGLVDP